MAKFAVFFVAALAFYVVLGAPKKPQSQTGAANNQIEDIASQDQHVVNDVSASLKNVLPENKQVTKVLFEHPASNLSCYEL